MVCKKTTQKIGFPSYIWVGGKAMDVHEHDQLLNIQKTKSRELRNNFLIHWKDEAFKTAYIYCREKLGREPTEEEKSIALNGMNEAIDRYDQKQDANFITFSSKVIFSRLIDFFRKEKTIRKHAVPHPNIALISDWRAMTDYNTKQFSEDLRDELVEAQEILSRFGYTWFDIIDNRPKHRDSLERLLWIGYRIVNLGFGERFLMEKSVHKELKKLIDVDQRTLRRYRPYLTALVVAYTHDLPIIRNYLERRRKDANL